MAIEQNRWLDEESFRYGVALCQTIPGATAIQTAAYVGLRTRGVSGALISYVGFALPAFILMLTFSALYTYTQTLPAVTSAFSGLQSIIVAIVANAAVSFGKTTVKDWGTIVIAAIAAILFGIGVNPLLVIAAAALLGLVLTKGQHAFHSPAALMHQSASIRSFLLLVASTGAVFFLLMLVERRLFDLALLMFRIDLFAFGGGFASIPLMFHEVVQVRQWMDSSTFLNGIALGQVTPGPIVITATFIGYMLYGIPGGLAATLGVFSPSFLMVVGVTPYFDRLRTLPYFNRAMTGILSSFVGLLLTVTVRFASDVQWDLPRLLFSCAAFVALLLKVDILWVVLIGTAISIVVL
jgi:chromate transporter